MGVEADGDLPTFWVWVQNRSCADLDSVPFAGPCTQPFPCHCSYTFIFLGQFHTYLGHLHSPHHSPLELFFSPPPSQVPPPLSSTAIGCVFVTLSLIRVAHMNTGRRLLTGTKTTYSGFTTEEHPPNFNQGVQNLFLVSFSSFPSILTSPHSSWMTPHICIVTA